MSEIKKKLPAGRQVKKFHFTGIKGVGMAPLAIIAKQAGIDVKGSDVPDKFITDDQLTRAGIKINKGFSKEAVRGKDLVISTAAHQGLDNIEIVAARQNGIKVLTQAEALGKFQKGQLIGKKFTGISVAGSHGKTTTTAIVATILNEGGMSPSFCIGTGNIPSLGMSGNLGTGKYFIAEADEYFTDLKYKRVPKFFYQDPKFLIITNIDFDHPDVYNSIEEIYKVFIKFAAKIPNEDIIICSGDGEKNRHFINKLNRDVITYGFDKKNDYVVENVETNINKTSFFVSEKNGPSNKYELNIFGKQNVSNRLSAIILCQRLGLEHSQIQKGLLKFTGTKRRQEYLGNIGATKIYDDYAHHPEEIIQTIRSFRERFVNHKIIAVFQPHTYSRTIKFFDEFATSFSEADEVIIMDVFVSRRETNIRNFSSKSLALEIEKTSKKTKYLPGVLDVVKYLSSAQIHAQSLIILLGAGDVYKVGEEVLENVSR